MSKTEAAEILVTWINVRARHYAKMNGRPVVVDKDFIEEMRAEALSATGRVKMAAEVCPDWTTIRTAARRMNAR